MTEKPIQQLSICTVRYSDNLGDGAISQCLGHIIHKADEGIRINECDLAGRTQYNTSSLGLKYRVLQFIYALPPFLGRVAFVAIWIFAIRQKALVAWEKSIKENFALVFGGGQLLQDDILNFPLKIYSLVKFARGKGCKVTFNAIGVSSKWSFAARKLFQKALLNEDVVFISVRDQKSYDNLLKHLGNSIKEKLTITADPAIYADEVYKVNNSKKYIGLGIAHPMALKASTADPNDFSKDHIARFWHELATLLVRKGYKPALITNGSFEDNKFLDEISLSLKEQIKNDDIVVYKRPLNPEELVSHLSDMKIVIAHRLHANILSYSIGVPTIGLIWDDKVAGFAEMTERSQYFIKSSEISPHLVLDILNSMPHEIDSKQHDKLKMLALDSVKRMLRAMNYSL